MSARRALAASGLATLLAACSSPDPLVWLPFPPADDAKSLIVGVERGGELRVWAIDLEEPKPNFTLPIAADGRFRLEALAYPESLDGLRIPPGEIVHDATGRYLPATEQIFTGEVRQLEISQDWLRTDRRPAGLERFRTEFGRAPCADFRATSLTMSTNSHGRFAIPTGGSLALAGTFNGKLFLVGDAGVREIETQPSGAHVTGGFRDASGTLWLGGHDGAVWTATISDRLVLTATTSNPSGGTMRWLAGQSDEAGADIVALTVEGAFLHYAGGRWNKVHQFPDGHTSNDHGGVAWIGPGEAVAVWPYSSQIVRLKQGRAQPESTPATSGLTAVRHTAHLGTVVGTAVLSILIREGGRWITYGPESGSGFTGVGAIRAHEDGLIFGIAVGAVRQYYPDHGLCEPTEVARHNIYDMARIGPHAFVLSGSPYAETQRPSPITVLHVGER